MSQNGPKQTSFASPPTIISNQSRGKTRFAELMARRPTKIAAIALANKIARIAWALMISGTRYREPAPQAI